MKIAKNYCREIAKALQQQPIFPPGEAVHVGDIISFKRRFFINQPFGDFKVEATLKELKVKHARPRVDPHPDPYFYASKNAVQYDIAANGQVEGLSQGAGSIQGKLNIRFTKEGAIYLLAVDCVQTQLVDIAKVRAQLEEQTTDRDLDGCYLVTGVSVAKRALIMISGSKSAELVLEGDVQGLQTGQALKIHAGADIQVTKSKDAAFIKDWSENVPVFYTLVHLRKSRKQNGAERLLPQNAHV